LGVPGPHFGREWPAKASAADRFDRYIQVLFTAISSGLQDDGLS
jgi:hypothetical protein